MRAFSKNKAKDIENQRKIRLKKGPSEKILITLIILLLAAGVIQTAQAEYIRATKQDELIFIPREQELKIGESIANSVEQKFGLAEDSLLQNKVDFIGQKLASVCDRKDITYHFKVITGSKLDPEQRINAFAVPGGYIYIFKDLLDMLGNDDEVAAVLAHEIGHITTKHSIKRLQGSLGMTALQILTSRIETDTETKVKASHAINLLMMAYSREDEFMADRLSVTYMKLAGYDPQGAVSVIDKLIEMQRKGTIKIYTSYRTHPYLGERKAVIRKEIHGQVDFVDFINMPN